MGDLFRNRRGAVIFFGLAAITPVVVRDAYFLDSLVLILLWGALSAAWNVAGGYAGQVSIGHASFFGIGAYSAALMVESAKYGPFRRLDKKPMMNPAPIERITPTNMPSQGPRPKRTTIKAAEYAPMPKNDAWPIETWPA